MNNSFPDPETVPPDVDFRRSAGFVKRDENHWAATRPWVLGRKRFVVEKTCMKPSYTLQWQVFLSFGVPSIILFLLVTILSCVATLVARNVARDSGRKLLRSQSAERVRLASDGVFASISAYQGFNEGAFQLAVEFVRERIVGYPNDGWEDDRHVPFLNSETNTSQYPLNGDPVPLDWQLDFNINDENQQEHLQGRWDWDYEQNSNVSMIDQALYWSSSLSGAFFFQGTCDLLAQPGSRFYAPNCTEARNNISTGGAVAPNNTTRSLHRKSSELQILLKALHESHDGALAITVHFFNNGAGATLQYPGMAFDRNFTHVSSGCEWMRTTNDATGRSYGTNEQIGQCHPAGSLVPGYEYNPWEENWIANVTRSTGLIHWFPREEIRSNGHRRVIVPMVAGPVLDQL
jgi:hypothetical protein